MDKLLNRYKILLIYLALILSAVAVYWQVMNYEFVNYDDPEYVFNNWHVTSGVTYQNFLWAFSTFRATNWHPVTWLSHMLDCQLFGTKAGWHHLTNLLLHIANTLLLFIVLKKMTGALWQSAFVAALFALHPLHVESVAWVAERKDVLSTLFLLLTMLAYTGYVKKPNAGRYLLTLLLFAFGLMAKPMLVTLPFVLLLLDYWPLERFGNNCSKLKICRRLVLEKVPFLVLVIASSVVTFIAQRSGGAMIDITRLPLYARVINALASYMAYIGKMFWPSNLAMFYPYPIHKLPVLQAVLSAAALLGISLVLIRVAGRHRFLLMGWLWYLGTLLPVIGIIQVGDQALADRYTYIPYTGLFIMIAWGLPLLLAKWKYQKIALGVSAAVVLMLLSICTYIQQRYWHDSITLFEHALKVTENNYVAHYCIAAPLSEQGKKEEALAHNYQTVRINPNYLDAYNAIGLLLTEENKPDQAIPYFAKALQVRPDFMAAHCNLGRTMIAMGDIAGAVAKFRELVQKLPNEPEAYYLLGSALAQQGNLVEAVAHLNKALQMNPELAEAHGDLGLVLVKQNRLDEGLAHLIKALEIDTDLVETRIELGYVFSVQGKLDQAAMEYQKLLSMHPDNATAHNDYAVLLIRQGKTDEAIKHLNDAIRIKPDYVNAQNNLRAILAMQKKPGKSAQPEVNSPTPPKTN